MQQYLVCHPVSAGALPTWGTPLEVHVLGPSSSHMLEVGIWREDLRGFSGLEKRGSYTSMPSLPCEVIHLMQQENTQKVGAVLLDISLQHFQLNLYKLPSLGCSAIATEKSLRKNDCSDLFCVYTGEMFLNKAKTNYVV